MTDIDKINKELVKPEDLLSLRELYPSIKHDFEKKTIFRTETEARVSVLNEINFPTPQAKYWQCVREQQVHFEQLVFLSFDYRKLKVELTQLQNKLKEEKDPLKAELLQIEIDRKQYDLILCRKVAEERVREVKQWAKIKDELSSTGQVDVENVDSMGRGQLKSHTERFIKRYLSMGNNVPPADLINLKGCAFTAVKECKRVGLWKEVKMELGLSDDAVKHLEAG